MLNGVHGAEPEHLRESTNWIIYNEPCKQINLSHSADL